MYELACASATLGGRKEWIEDIDKRTYSAPPPAGPIALKNDIAVMEMPLAAPLWC